MLVQKIAPKVRPYILSALLCAGMSPLFAKEQPHDKFVKQEKSVETVTEIQNDDGYIKYLIRGIALLPIVGLFGIMKLANHIERKELEEEEKEKAEQNIQK